jgi:hypothetical protein
MLRRIFGLKRDDITGEGRRLHIEQLNDLYSSPNTRIILVIKSRRMRWAGHVAHIAYTGFCWGNLRALERPRCRWEVKIKMDLQEVVWGGMDWTDLALDRGKWRALLTRLWNFGFHKMRGIS